MSGARARTEAGGADVACRAVVFDLDDTLVDWWGAIRRAAGEVVDEATADQLLEVTAAEAWHRRADGAVHRDHWRLWTQPEVFWEPIVASEADRTEIVDRFGAALRPGLFVDARPALDGLADLRVGMLSNTVLVDRRIAQLGIETYFSCAIGLDDPIRKPHPAGFAQICEALHVEPAEVVFVGDSAITDVEPAVEAGMTAVWLDRFDDDWDPPAGAHRLGGLGEVRGLIEAVV